MAIGLVAMPRIVVGQQLTTGHAFVGPVLVPERPEPAGLAIGGGVERSIGKASSVGAEIENVYLPAFDAGYGCCTSSSGPSLSAWLFSFNGTRYITRSVGRPRWNPFITGGVGVIAAGEPMPVINVGGGADRWMTPHRGVRWEIEGQLTGATLLSFRVGIMFR
ncbi:MAG: hypothetical protein ABJA98_33725 [Acidobacteriota bacterium]